MAGKTLEVKHCTLTAHKEQLVTASHSKSQQLVTASHSKSQRLVTASHSS